MMNFKIWSEIIPDKGEDAPPTFLAMESTAGVIAVYDGLGGAGSKTYSLDLKNGNKGTFSGAYLAARLAKKTLEHYFESNFPLPLDALALESQLKTSFRDFEAKLPENPSKLRSKLIKSLPTTLAGIYYDTRSADSLFSLQAFWAGDSRCYLLNHQGLQQLSSDDLKGQPDALENLEEDATISNCLEAKGN
ncbi:MAG: serine/threonine protein phosphatase, partial [Bacteroidota bacterium]